MSNWTEGDVNTNGIRLHYHRTGGDKPPVVLAHGITDNGLCWTRLAQALEDRFDLIMVDARGHGDSDKPETDYGPHHHADDLAGLIEILGLGQPAVIGHSMGGATAAVLAERHPKRVGRLILEDPAWFPRQGVQANDDSTQRAREWSERIAQRKSLARDELVAQGQRDNPLWDAAEFPAWVQAKQQVSPNVTHFMLQRYKPWWELLPAIQSDTLILTGDVALGAIITPEVAQEITALSPRVQVVRLSGAGHNVRRERFAEYLDHVRRFLS